MGTISDRIGQIFAIGKENSWDLFGTMAVARNDPDKLVNLISRTVGLPRGFFALPESEAIGS
jgi:hypothetical protein